MHQVTEWRSYHGSHTTSEFDQQPAVKWTPQRTGHSRHVSKSIFIPPIQIAGWIHILDADPQENWDGIRFHLGHIGNNRNYILDMVRPDNHMTISREYGWRDYDDLARDTQGLDLIEGGTYVFQIVWEYEDALLDGIHFEIANETATKTLSAEVELEANQGDHEGSHVPRLPVGSIGWRLDHINAVGQVAVRELY